MKRLILIDGNNLGFAGMANPKLSAGEKNTQAIFSVIRRVRHIISDHPDAIVTVLWDGRSWRNDIYSEYKANREKTEKQEADRSAYYQQAKDIKKGLHLLGVIQTWALNMEADDLAQIFTKRFVDSGGRVTLMTADKDWQQLVCRDVIWIDTINDRRCDAYNFTDITGCRNLEQFLERKCIEGDVGDNIKGINGIGPKKVDAIFDMYESFRLFLGCRTEYDEEVWLKTTGKKLPKVLRELDKVAALDKLHFNMKLVDLATPHRPAPVNLTKTQMPLAEAQFKEFCYQNAFLSFMKDYDRFLLPFRENKYIKKVN